MSLPPEFLPESLFDAETDAERIFRNESLAVDAYKARMGQRIRKGNIYLALKSREMGKTPGFLRDVEETKKDSEILINEIPQVAEEARRVAHQAIRDIRAENAREPIEFEQYLQRIAQRRDEIEQADDLLILGRRMRREMPEQVATHLNLLREEELINYPDPEELINDMDRLNI